MNEPVSTNKPELKPKKPKPKQWGWLILFASTSTLLCCALPIILVSLGFGAVVASLATNIPILITLSQHKLWVFLTTALLLCLAGWLLYRPGRICPTDPELTKQCANAHQWNVRLFWCSVIVWLMGFISAYVLVIIAW